tara:strand:+ start:240 stop:341 length:102 start_codon:yes stop_codon:yes gene_type:complete
MTMTWGKVKADTEKKKEVPAVSPKRKKKKKIAK